MKNFRCRKIFVTSILVFVLALVTISIQSNMAHASEVQKGVALKSPTHVYENTSTDSKVLKSYGEGSILQYRSHSANWYSATVYINGKRHSGYIHTSHVDNIVSNQDNLSGIGLQNPTAVFAQASTNSKKLKTYAGGTILKYRTFSSSWYEATVYLNGKATTGYIHKNHVESMLNTSENLRGIGLASPTSVYSRASTSASKLKSYPVGSILRYRTFSENWYEATVYVRGKATTGYIPKSHVEDAVDAQQNLQGIGLQNLTSVYANASTGSKKLRSYAQGTILKYKTFSSNWYEAVVYLNGKATTGYIHTSHVEGIYNSSQSLDGIALKSPTNVYSRASKGAGVLRSYPKGNYLLFKTLSPNWYEATVYISGKRTTGYIHKDDVSTDRILTTVTNYPTDFKRVVDIQMTRTPKADGAGRIPATRSQVEYYVNSSNFSKASTHYYQFLVLSQPANLNANEVNQKILFDHGTLTNTAAHFIEAGNKFNVNEAYLISHALHETGNGKSALASGVPVDNNGNVVKESEKVHTVYNMYGIGAYDDTALRDGAKRAFDEGWFSPKEAIIGGAEFINSYIGRGQDTLYKMRWNPSSPGHPQYATHVAWATIQTYNISRIYSLLDRYVLIYDVPRYANQPSSSGSPNNNLNKLQSTMSLFKTEVEDPVDTDESNTTETPESDEEVELEETPELDDAVESEGESDIDETDEEVETEESTETDEVIAFEEEQVYGVSSKELELREASNDLESEVYAGIPEGTKLQITAIDGTWYETEYDGHVGWVNGEDVTLLNLLEVSVDNVNVYNEPNDLTDPIDTVLSETLLIAVLDENDTIIQENEWIQVLYNDKAVWVKNDENLVEYATIE